MKKNHREPRLVVFSTLFPNSKQANAGVFIKERMFRVAQHLPLIVVAPTPWFPGQSLIRLIKPHFRPNIEKFEVQDGINVYHPRFISIPGYFKWLDGYFLAFSCYFLMKKLKKEFQFSIIDSHFAYPDGFAATKLGKWLSIPVTITLRGTEVRHLRTKSLKLYLKKAFFSANKIFAVSSSLKQEALHVGVPDDKVVVIGNGVDSQKFYPFDKHKARQKLSLQSADKVMITVGGLVERKGFHRVIELMPRLLKKYPSLHYLIIGGSSAEGDWSHKLKVMVKDLKLEQQVTFLGVIAPEEIKNSLSAADIFVLATRNEGWANVILEAMACGLPVIATDVGGNAEVVKNNDIGTIVPFGEADKLEQAIDHALQKNWSKETIIHYANDNSWDNRVSMLIKEFKQLLP